MALDKTVHPRHCQLPEANVKGVFDISPSALREGIKVGMVAVVVAAVPTGCSPAPTDVVL